MLKTMWSVCTVCQYNKSMAVAPADLLRPLTIPDRVWKDISMDFIEGLPKSTDHDAFLVVVDCLSKYGHFIPVSHPFSGKTIATVFVKEIVRLHGFPKSIAVTKFLLATSGLSSFDYKTPVCTEVQPTICNQMAK